MNALVPLETEQSALDHGQLRCRLHPSVPTLSKIPVRAEAHLDAGSGFVWLCREARQRALVACMRRLGNALIPNIERTTSRSKRIDEQDVRAGPTKLVTWCEEKLTANGSLRIRFANCHSSVDGSARQSFRGHW